MALFDRKYWKEPGGTETSGSPLTFGMPRPGRTVKALLLINIGVYVFQLFADQRGLLTLSLGVTAAEWWQLWRYITFQFLHSVVDPWHIIFNMLGLYMLGTPLEQLWGGKRFLTFYLGCGAAAGLAYVLIGTIFGGFVRNTPIIGASGGVFGVVMACAILFPYFQIILIFFPLPIRLAAVLIFGVAIVMVVRSFANHVPSAMSDVAHLGGAATAAFWVLLGPRLHESLAFSRQRMKHGSWQRKLAQKRQRQEEIDRILQKIHDGGIGSLTNREKKTLQDASREQQKEDRKIRSL